MRCIFEADNDSDRLFIMSYTDYTELDNCSLHSTTVCTSCYFCNTYDTANKARIIHFLYTLVLHGFSIDVATSRVSHQEIEHSTNHCRGFNSF